MDNEVLISDLKIILESPNNLDRSLSELMIAIADTLKVDRCFLYVRNPETRIGRAAFCYCRNPEVPDVSSERWERESSDLEAEDPMFAAALDCKSTIFVEDVETADPNVVNRDFEAKAFGHRALIHAHLCQEGKLWGILQPCVFNRPRQWTEKDQQIIEMVVDRVTPLVKQYVKEHLESAIKDN